MISSRTSLWRNDDANQDLSFGILKNVEGALVTVMISTNAANIEVSAVASKDDYRFTVRANEAGYRAAAEAHTSTAVGQWVDKEFTVSVVDDAGM